MLHPCRADEEDDLPAPGIVPDARRQDDYWSAAWRRERYVRPDCEYEDYAPAYCVGYVGFAQYGGEFDQAERSLFANWERIKGSSRLTPQEARAAFRAAWERESQRSHAADWAPAGG